MRKIVKILLFLCVFSEIKAQNQSFSPKVQPLFEYEISLRTYYRKLWEAQRAEFLGLNQKSALFYLPDVGFQFGLPSVNLRLSNYLQYQQDRKIIELKLKSIDENIALELNDKLQQLRIDYQKLKLEFERLKTNQDKMVFVERLHEITLECCQKRACTPEDCRKKELEHFEQKQALKEAEINFDILVLEFEKSAKYKLPDLKF